MSISATFKALSDPQRREILELLRGGRKNAGELASVLGISAPALSYHLRLLKEADLLLEYREGNYIYFELNAGVFDEIILWVNNMRGEQ
ncbi:MAG: winged helix-turn-helix transcriptional regulator [Victivallales bacterium]|nr:winged helix-turn-helix transcriptional regulator [Victivallales bacterium]